MSQLILIFLLQRTPLFYWTQSLWRDEAFSVWIAKNSIAKVIERTANDFNPPLYYLLLNFWMKLFGTSEIAMRSLSLLGFALLVILMYHFARLLWKSTHVAWFATLLTLSNPMLVYYAFELRMYSLFALFATASMYFFVKNNLIWYLLTTAAGLYTQPFMAFVVFVQMIHLGAMGKWKTAIRNSVLVAILYVPWIPTLLAQFSRSGPMWMYPIDANLVISVLGNLFTGYEGTPGHLWLTMPWISIAIIIFSTAVYIQKPKKEQALLLFWLYIPLILVLSISLIKPVYVNRYVIFLTVAEILIIAGAVNKMHKRLQIPLMWTLIILSLWGNVIAIDFHRKVDIRSTFQNAMPLIDQNTVIYAETPLVFYESLYYAPPKTNVYLYNPDRITPPRYVGSEGMPEEVWKDTFPVFPHKAVMIEEDGGFRVVTKK